MPDGRAAMGGRENGLRKLAGEAVRAANTKSEGDTTPLWLGRPVGRNNISQTEIYLSSGENVPILNFFFFF